MTKGIGPYQYNVYQNQVPANFNGDTTQIPEAAVDKATESGVGHTFMDIPSDLEGWKKFAPYFGLAAGGSLLLKYGIEKLCAPKGRIEDSKLYKWGQKIDNMPGAQRVSNGIESFFSSIKTGVGRMPWPDSVRKLAATIKTGAEPRLGMARSMMHGPRGFQLEHTIGRIKDLPAANLDAIGITDVINKFKAGKIDAYKTYAQIADKLAKAPEGALSGIKIPRHFPLTSWKLPGRLGEKVADLRLDVTKSRFFDAKAGKTLLSRYIPRHILNLGESITGGMIGGTVGILINALFLGTALKKAKNAPKGEKVSTFMEEFLGNMVGGFLLMPIVQKVFYKGIGIKYLGIKGGKDGYQTALKELQAKIAANAPKAEIQAEIKALKEMSSFKRIFTKEVPLLHKPFAFIGRLLGAGLDKIPRLTARGKTWTFLKGFGGGTMRFVIMMLVLMPPVTKVLMKISHSIFGKPTKSLIDEGKNQEKPVEQVNQPQNQQTAQNPEMPNFFNQNQPQLTVNQPQQSESVYLPATTPVKLVQPKQVEYNQTFIKSDKILEHASDVLNEVTGKKRS